MEPCLNPKTCSHQCNSQKRGSQWDELMRKFSREHEKECKQTILKIPQARRSTKLFPTGSQYEGSWDILGMSGYGKYTFPNGVTYEGDFEDGMFHGVGELQYPDGTAVRGTFSKGVISNRKLIFADGLIYEEENWRYCKMPDRRYTIEYEEGLEPAGRCNITAEMPPRVIPPGFYDTGDGFYDPKTLSVYKADDLSFVLRSPSEHEQKWIVANCRTSPETVLGPRIDLYEEWLAPELKLPNPPPPAASTRNALNRKRSTHSFCCSGNEMHDTFASQIPHRLRTYIHEDSCDTSLNQEQSTGFNIDSNSRIIDKVKSYNLKIAANDTLLKFTTVPKNYSELFSQNIKVALATLLQNPKDAAFQHSDNKSDKKDTESGTYSKSNKDYQVEMHSRTVDILANDSCDLLPSAAQSFRDDEDSDSKSLTRQEPFSLRAAQSMGLTSSVLMFRTVDVNTEEDKFVSRKPSEAYEA